MWVGGRGMTERIIGQTKTVGFQVGVRRTLPITQEKAWQLVSSPEGLALWLGEGGCIHLHPGAQYQTDLGAGEIRIVKPLQ